MTMKKPCMWSIYNGEVSVCVSVTKRHHFPYSKDFVVSPVYSYKGILKGIGRFHVSWHFCSQKIWSFLLFPMCVTKMLTFRIQKIWSFLTFIATFRTQRNWRFHVSWHFCIQRIWSFLMFIETVRHQNPLKCSKNLSIFLFLDTLCICVSRKCLLSVFKRFGCFSRL